MSQLKGTTLLSATSSFIGIVKNRVKESAIVVLAVVVLGVSIGSYYKSTTIIKLESQNTSLISNNAKLESDIKKVEKINSDNLIEISKLKASLEASNNVIINNTQKVKEEEKRYAQLQKKVQEKIEAIDRHYRALEPSKENEQRRAIEISLERSRGVWLLYCNAVPEAQECK